MPSTKPTNFVLRRIATALLCTALLAGPALAIDSGGGGGQPAGMGVAAPSGPSLDDGRALIRAGKWKAAVATLKQVVAQQPNNADALNLLGYSLRKSGDMRNAQGFYLKALKLNPRHKGANEYLGELYVEIGQIGKAKERLQALQQLCGNTSCEEYQDLAKVIAAAG